MQTREVSPMNSEPMQVQQGHMPGMPIQAANPALTELITSFHAGKPIMAWITFSDGAKPCSACGIPKKNQVLTSPQTGICNDCWEYASK